MRIDLIRTWKRLNTRQVRSRHAQFAIVVLTWVGLMLESGCTAAGRPQAGVAAAWQRDRVTEVAALPSGGDDVAEDLPSESESQTGDIPAIAAKVNDRPIASQRVVALLIAGRGAEVLHDLVSLEIVRAEAESLGLRVSRRELVAEKDRTLRAMGGSAAASDDAPFDRTAAEAMLDEVLSRRGVSREEFQIAVERNALLRKIAERRIQVSEDDLADEYQRAYGRRAYVRHIQVASMRQAERVHDELSAGADFADLARQLSTAPSAREGGLLPPMTETDPGVPGIVRETVFVMHEGQVSSAIRVGYGYQILLVERFGEPADIPFAQARADLEAQLRDRLTEEQMPALLVELQSAANVQVLDPMLKSRYERLMESVSGQEVGVAANGP